MSKFVDGIGSLFKGADTSAADRQIAQQREDQQIALNKQTQDLQNQNSQQDKNLAGVIRQPKGRRLLLAATGERGVSSTLGG